MQSAPVVGDGAGLAIAMRLSRPVIYFCLQVSIHSASFPALWQLVYILTSPVLAASAARPQQVLCQPLMQAFLAQPFISELHFAQPGRVQPLKVAPGGLPRLSELIAKEIWNVGLRQGLAK